MKKLILIITLCLAIAPCAHAAEAPTSNETDLTRRMQNKLGEDFRVIFEFVENARICGGEGDAYVGQVEMNKYSRAQDEKGNLIVKDNWVRLDKTYSIFLHELTVPDAQLFDQDKCME